MTDLQPWWVFALEFLGVLVVAFCVVILGLALTWLVFNQRDKRHHG